MQKRLSIVIKASQDFIRHTDEDIKANAPILNNFYEAISNVYIPLLRMIEKLEQDKVTFRFGLVLPPVLCNMLSDSVLQKGYIEWLENRNTFGKAELRRNKADSKLCEVISGIIENNKSLLADSSQPSQGGVDVGNTSTPP